MSGSGETSTGGPERGRRCPAWLGVALVLSLGANLLVGGIYLGEALSGEERSERRKPYAERVVGYLPEPRQAEAREILEAGAPDGAAMAARLVAATAEVEAALVAEPFDPAALEAALSHRMGVFRERFDHRLDRLVVLAETLPAEERRMLGEGLRARTERFVDRFRKTSDE